MYSKQKGLTLIELMVTVSILIILSTVGMPALGQFVRITQQESVFQTLKSTYIYARQEAVHRGEKVRICPVSGNNPGQCSNDWTGGMLVYIDRGGAMQFGSGDELLREVYFDGVGQVTWRNNDYMLKIDPDGTIPGDNGTFRIFENKQQVGKALTIAPTGRARITY